MEISSADEFLAPVGFSLANELSQANQNVRWLRREFIAKFWIQATRLAGREQHPNAHTGRLTFATLMDMSAGRA
jgi:hypothetical protein